VVINTIPFLTLFSPEGSPILSEIESEFGRHCRVPVILQLGPKSPPSVLRRRRLPGSASILSFLRSIYPVGALLHQLFDYPRSDASLFSHKTCWFHILLIDLRGPIIHIYGDRLGSLNILSPFIPRLGLENGSTRRNCKVRITVRHLPGRRSLTLLTILALNP
jgi:hypothetical protein